MTAQNYLIRSGFKKNKSNSADRTLKPLLAVGI